MEAPTQLVTQAQYAEHRGVSRQAVNKLVLGEKIPVHVQPNGDKLIDPAEADHVLGEIRERIDEPRGEGNAETVKLTKARTYGAVYDAKMAQLKYEQALDRILPRDGVAASMTALGEAVVRNLSVIATRAEDVALAAGKDGVAGVRQALKAIVREVRNEMATALDDAAAKAIAAHAATVAAPADDESVPE